MKKLMLSTLTAITLGLPMAAMADQALGNWKTSSDDEGFYYIVSIAKCDSGVCGTIKGTYDAQGKPAPQPEDGKRMIWDMKSEGNGKYEDGKIWDPLGDKTYASKMEVKGNKLKVKGCVAGGLICDTDTWTRAK
ncbi:DUF2147 domain-containing protein [Ruegeria halocynthiae]|uniref:DUF2147 domain-containing protein n=1 Tax=Ruegeria halocynthiae TaxID=985054 RepID=UPI0005605BF2|nr:DUF2147 domain-containing protein [Ruegeria halocynthiae]